MFLRKKNIFRYVLIVLLFDKNTMNMGLVLVSIGLIHLIAKILYLVKFLLMKTNTKVE